MYSIDRATLTAAILAASVTFAHAQMPSGQDHASHHLQTPGAEQMPAPPGMPMGPQGVGPAPMGGNMGQMMEMMRHMMGSMASTGQPVTPPSVAESSHMGAMMQSMGQMMTMMGRMMEERGMGGPAEEPAVATGEQRIALLKSALEITDAQMPQWTAFVAALQSGAEKIRMAYAEALHGGRPTSAPDRAELRLHLLSTMLSSLKTTVAAEKSLYAVLSDDQKHTADQLLSGPARGL